MTLSLREQAQGGGERDGERGGKDEERRAEKGERERERQ